MMTAIRNTCQFSPVIVTCYTLTSSCVVFVAPTPKNFWPMSGASAVTWLLWIHYFLFLLLYFFLCETKPNLAWMQQNPDAEHSTGSEKCSYPVERTCCLYPQKVGIISITLVDLLTSKQSILYKIKLRRQLSLCLHVASLIRSCCPGTLLSVKFWHWNLFTHCCDTVSTLYIHQM